MVKVEKTKKKAIIFVKKKKVPKKAKSKAKASTLKQKKLIQKISENLGNTNRAKSMYQIMIEAGYAKTTAKQQSTVLVRVKDDVKSLITKLEEKRDLAISHLTEEKLITSNAKELSSVIDKLTKNVELLSGRPTDIKENKLPEEERDLINQILYENS